MVMKYTPISDAEAERIKRETLERDQVEPRLAQVVYEAATGHLNLTFKDGTSLSFPARKLKSLATATDTQLSDLRVMSRGSALFFDSLDVQMTTIALLQLLFALPTPAAIGRKGGSVSSDAKRVAARANGAKGGRPSKKPDVVVQAKGAVLGLK